MKRTACMMSAFSLVALVALSAGADDKEPTIKEAMQKLHKGANAPLGQIKKGLAAPKTNWKDVQAQTEIVKTLGATLPKNDPPRGDGASYKRLAEAYANNAKALDEAAQKEDKSTSKAALGKLQTSCMRCHSAHKKM